MTEPLTWRVKALVERIVDGDTFVATLDLGWGLFRVETKGAPCRIRLLGYNSPERKDPDYASAKAELAAVMPIGSEVWVTSHALDSFGRALCQITLMDGGDLLDLLPPQYRIARP